MRLKDFLQTVTGKIKIARLVFKNGEFEEEVIFRGDVLDLKKDWPVGIRHFRIFIHSQ